jgi:drug/metabolite transporter (DMT)-like permease
VALERDRPVSWNRVSIGALVYLAVLGSAVTFSVYYWLLARLPAKRVALVSYIVPIVAVLVGTLRGEALTARTLLGSAVVIAGVALAVQPAAAAASGSPS